MDSAGNAYVAGETYSTDFPVTSGAFQTTYGGGLTDAFVTKLNPEGSALLYSTYLGGTCDEGGGGIAVDSAGDAYVTGGTCSGDFPVTPGAFQMTSGGGDDAFVTKLNPEGSALLYSTRLGGLGLDWASGIAVDGAGDAYVTGITDSTNFPTKGPLQGTYQGGTDDVFVTRINSAGSALVFSTYLGGKSYDGGHGIAVDNSNTAYVSGNTESSNFPKKNAFQGLLGGGYDAFVAKIDTRSATMTMLTSSPNPSIYGQTVTFTAVVTSTLGALPDGETVKFMKGATVLGTGSLSGGSASFTTSALPAGTNYIKAVYGGDANLAASTSNTVSQIVSKATTTTTLTSSLNPSNFGQSATFTATVTPQFSHTVNGTVTFYDGTTLLKTTSLSGGAAKFTTSTLASGTHSITATYNGSASFDGSTSAPLIRLCG